MLRGAKAFDYAAKDGDRFAKFGGGDELARAVRHAYVAGAEDDRVRAQLGHALDARDESRRARDGRRARRGVRAVPLAPAHANVREAVALARAYGPQGCRLAHDGVPHAEGAGLRQALRAETPDLLVRRQDERERSRELR